MALNEPFGIPKRRKHKYKLNIYHHNKEEYTIRTYGFPAAHTFFFLRYITLNYYCQTAHTHATVCYLKNDPLDQSQMECQTDSYAKNAMDLDELYTWKWHWWAWKCSLWEKPRKFMDFWKMPRSVCAKWLENSKPIQFHKLSGMANVIIALVLGHVHNLH